MEERLSEGKISKPKDDIFGVEENQNSQKKIFDLYKTNVDLKDEIAAVKINEPDLSGNFEDNLLELEDKEIPKVNIPEAQAESSGSGENASDPIITLKGLKISEVNEQPFPFPKLYHWVPNGQHDEQLPTNFSLIVTKEVLLEVNSHVSESLERELGGFLLGNRYYCPVTNRDYIRIDNYSNAKFSHSDEVSINLSPETWNQLQEELDGKFRGKQLLGWYHSHPRMSVFLSPMDVNVHTKHFSSNKLSIALVVEPEGMTGGFFCWRWDKETDPLAENKELHRLAKMDFYELKEPNSNETYMPWREYACFDALTDEPIHPELVDVDYTLLVKQVPQRPIAQAPKQPDYQLEITTPAAPPPEVRMVSSDPIRRPVSIPKSNKKNSIYPILALALAGLALLAALVPFLYFKFYYRENTDDPKTRVIDKNNKTEVAQEPVRPANDAQPEIEEISFVETGYANTKDKPFHLFINLKPDIDKDSVDLEVDGEPLTAIIDYKKSKEDDPEIKSSTLVYDINSLIAKKLPQERPGTTIKLNVKIKDKSDSSRIEMLPVNAVIGAKSEVATPVPKPQKINPPPVNRKVDEQSAAPEKRQKTDVITTRKTPEQKKPKIDPDGND